MSRYTVRTFTGKQVNIADPNPKMICTDDIAHALSNICLFNGHYPRFLSIAEHSLKVVDMLKRKYHNADPSMLIHGLLSEASQAYLPNLPSAIKKNVDKEYLGYEQVLMDIIYSQNGVDESKYLLEVEEASKACYDVYMKMWIHGTEDNKSAKGEFYEREFKKVLGELRRARDSYKGGEK